MKKILSLICFSLLLTCFAHINLKAQTAAFGVKKVRLALSPVKTTAVSEGINALELATAIQNTFGEYLKSPNIELVAIEARLPSAIEAEVKEKRVDYLISVTVSHKKGGGGLGKMFGSVAPILGQIAPVAGMSGNVVGAVAGHVAASAIMTAATLSQNVKAKDSIEINIAMQKAGGKSGVLTKQLKSKAKSDGEDIISPLIEQAAQTIIDAAVGNPLATGTEK